MCNTALGYGNSFTPDPDNLLTYLKSIQELGGASLVTVIMVCFCMREVIQALKEGKCNALDDK